MKKIFNYVGLLVIVLGSVFSISLGNVITIDSKKVNASNGKDITAPVCSVIVPEKVAIGKTVNAVVGCYDISGLMDTTISASDFKVRGGLLLKKVKVVEVSKAYTSDNMSYTWNIKLKGVFFGNGTITLDSLAVTDRNGIGNAPVLPKNIKVTLK